MHPIDAYGLIFYQFCQPMGELCCNGPALDAFPLHFCKFGGVVWMGESHPYTKWPVNCFRMVNFLWGIVQIKHNSFMIDLFPPLSTSTISSWNTSNHSAGVVSSPVLPMRCAQLLKHPAEIVWTCSNWQDVEHSQESTMEHPSKNIGSRAAHVRDGHFQPNGPVSAFSIRGEWVWYRRLQRLWRWYVGFPSSLQVH